MDIFRNEESENDARASFYTSPTLDGALLRENLAHFSDINSFYVKDSGESTLHNLEPLTNNSDPIQIYVTAERVENISSLFKNKQLTYISHSLNSPSSKEWQILGYQRHLKSRYEIAELKKISLGQARVNMLSVEPFLRKSQNAIIDLSCIRKGDAIFETEALPTGFYAEEACQIMRYLGEAPNLANVVIKTTVSPNNDYNLVCSLIWYLLEGISLAIKDHPNTHATAFDQFVVNVKGTDIDIEFCKHTKTNKWWFKSSENTWNPTSYDIYKKTINGDIPDELVLNDRL